MSQTPQRVFIVEDEMIVAFEMSDLLEDMGFEVVGPSIHLEDAKERAREDDFDVAFLDVNLGRDKTSKQVRDILEARGIPYVFITAYDAGDVEFIDEQDRVLKKPINGPALVGALRAAIKQQ